MNPFGWMAKDPEPPERMATPVAGQYVKWGDFELELGVEPPPHRAVLQSRVIATYGKVRMRPGDVIRSETSITEFSSGRARWVSSCTTPSPSITSTSTTSGSNDSTPCS
jgi:hypothetical protein